MKATMMLAIGTAACLPLSLAMAAGQMYWRRAARREGILAGDGRAADATDGGAPGPGRPADAEAGTRAEAGRPPPRSL